MHHVRDLRYILITGRLRLYNEKNIDMNQSKIIHGGEYKDNYIEHDFSVNVNPVTMPQSVITAMHDAIEFADRYPERQSESLTAELASALHIKESEIVIGNGSSELFMAVANAFSPRKIVIPVPSFFGYEYAATAGENDVNYVELSKEDDFAFTKEFVQELKERMETEDQGLLLYLANPNNPTGKTIDSDLLSEIIRFCKEHGIIVVLDECFYEFTNENKSMFQRIDEFPNLIVISSFTKTFSIPGIRLGYLACSDENTLKRIRRKLPEWNVSSIAQAAGIACLKHPEHMMKSAEYVKNEREYLEGNLKELGIKVFDSDANFLLIYSEKPLYEELLRRGIGIRDASNFRGLEKGFYRIAVKSHEENELFIQVLKEIL